MKKPVVASKLPPLDELVIHEKTGYLISPNNTHEWVDTLSLLLLNKALAQRIGEDAFTFCRERFINTHHVTQISALYQKIL